VKYPIVVETGKSSFGAHVPALPGCIAVAKSRAQVLRAIDEAIAFHLDDLHAQGLNLPLPNTSSALAELSSQAAQQHRPPAHEHLH